MKQKIEWYREVLELEPGSRVFFPLAKLLAADGQIHDAIITLRQGVIRHPGHVEARLLLVELLASEGTQSDLGTEVERLGALLSEYPGFWSAWSEILAKNPAMQDASLALRFFAAALSGKTVTWTAVIEQGLSTLLAGKAESPALALRQEPAPIFSKPPEAVDPIVASEEAELGATLAHTEPEKSEPESTLLEEPFFAASVEDEAPSVRLHLSEPEDDEEEPEETFSLRTRSMAEVLAEQGDLSGALDIYQELIAEASSDERVSLEARAEELARRMKSGPAHEEIKPEKGIPLLEGNRLVALLDSLAQRLEARAR